MSDILIVEQAGAVRQITLNRPECRNALSQALLDALWEAVDSAMDDDSVGAVVLTGAPPAFCAGLDLREVAQTRDDPERARATSERLFALLERIRRGPRAVVAAVNGPAVAGGAGLMTACDVVIAGESAKIGYPEVRRGLVAAIVMPLLLRQVGQRHARYLLLTGELVDARQAAAMGLVNDVVPDGEVVTRARAVAEAIAGFPREAVAHTKRLVAEVEALPPDAGSEMVRRAHTEMRTSGASSAVRDFLEKRSR